MAADDDAAGDEEEREDADEEEDEDAEEAADSAEVLRPDGADSAGVDAWAAICASRSFADWMWPCWRIASS